MIYALLGVLLAVFGGGFWVSHEWDKAQLWQMENAINQQKAEAEAVLKRIIARVEQQTQEQVTANINLEKARQSSIETINAYHEKYNIARTIADRLRANANACSGIAMPGGHSSELHQEHEANRTDLPEKFGQLLADESRRADECAVDKNAILTWALSKHGISK